jgi:hypothetical protein
MHVKIISILLTFFIVVIVCPAGAGDVKSMEYTLNHEATIKMDENRIAFQKSKAPARQPVSPFKKLIAGSQLKHSYSPADHGTIMGAAIFCVNFLKTMEETKKLRPTDSLQKAIHSSEVFHNPWKDRVLSSGEINKTDSSNSSLSHPILGLNQNLNGDKYVEEGNIRSTPKLIQLKREEIFNEIFMGLRFSFGAKSKPLLVEMNISPSPEKRPGLTIAF